jgi:hypothetical protein
MEDTRMKVVRAWPPLGYARRSCVSVVGGKGRAMGLKLICVDP